MGGVCFDFKAGFSNAGAIGQGQVAPIRQRLGRAHLQFPWFRACMIGKRALAQTVVAVFSHDLFPIGYGRQTAANGHPPQLV